MILIIIALYFTVFHNQSVVQTPTITLDEEQKQVDNFISDYYQAQKDDSVERILTFFEDNAILSAPDSKVYEDKSNIVI